MAAIHSGQLRTVIMFFLILHIKVSLIFKRHI
jgi:hypothetical protein